MSQLLPRGLYKVKRPKRNKLRAGEHYAVADTANVLGLLRPHHLFDGSHPTVIVEQGPPRLRAEVVYGGLSHEWTVEAKIENEADAPARLQAALADPEYRVLGNNCEDVASLIATGEKRSPQVLVAVVIVGLFVAVWLLAD